MLYLFAGESRKTSVASFLKEKAAKGKFHVEVEEIDIMRREEDDLSLQSKQEELLGRIRSGEFDAVICTPPCSTWSRVRAANMRGPPPIRDFAYPWGYPWVKKKYEEELKLGNILVVFTIKVVETVEEMGWVFILVEHPEDLGTVVREEDRAILRPASIWQLQELRKVVRRTIYSVAINQCCWGTPWRKPTRLLSNSKEIKEWGPTGWPQFDEEGYYTGPLQQNCSCKITTTLAKKDNSEGFRTTGTSVYPPRLDEAIAEAIISHCKVNRTRSPKVGEKRTCATDLAMVEEGHKKKKEKDEGALAEAKQSYPEIKDPGRAEEEEEVGGEKGQRPGFGVPMQCFYKGKHRTIHDGGGLGSPGRWPVEQRKQMRSRDGLELAAVVKAQFLKWLLKNGEKEVKEAFWKLARQEVDKVLKALGKSPERMPGDRQSEIAFRRLEAMAEVCEDEDSKWLIRMAEKGVPLGVDEELPRVERVFEPKEKWSLDFVEEALRDSVAENYKSAEESAEDIERQVLEEVDKGSIVVMSEEEVKERYRGRLAVAAL